MTLAARQTAPRVRPESGEREDFLLANLAALWRKDPRLAMEIDALDDEQRLKVEPSRSGLPTAKRTGPDGRSRYLHSKYDPAREASEQADAAIRTDALCYVVCGCGLGYVVAELFERLPEEASIAVLEDDPRALAGTLELHDFAGQIRGDRLTFITRADTGHLHERMSPHNFNILAGLQFVASPGNASEFLTAARAGVADFVAFTRTAVLTLLSNNEVTARNVHNNLAHYLAAPDISVLKNRFAGLPAVVVSAGPSLGPQLPRLKAIADRVVIIAVQTTLRVLLEAGIRPHFVTSLDYNAISRQFFQDLPPDALADVHLVAEPKASWHVIDAYAAAGSTGERPAMISLLGNDLLETMLGRASERRCRLTSGATVAHLAFYLAQHLGCDPILFVGQDLGFSNGSYYTPGTAIHRVWSPELNRFNSLEAMEWRRIVRQRNRLRKLTDVHGRPIYLDEQMFTYLQQFQRDFEVAPQRIIDATGGGVRKVGAEVMDLADAAERFATRPIPPEALAYREQADWFDGSKLDLGRRMLRERIEQAHELTDICERTLALLARLVELLESDLDAFNRALADMDELRSRVQHYTELFGMVSFVSQTAEYHRFRADRTLRLRGADGLEKARFQLARDQAYVSEIKSGCDRLAGILAAALERIEQRIETRDDTE